MNKLQDFSKPKSAPPVKVTIITRTVLKPAVVFLPAGAVSAAPVVKKNEAVKLPATISNVGIFTKFKNYFSKPAASAAKTKLNNEQPEKLPIMFKLSLEDQMMFAKRLAIMLKAGVPILESLTMMQKQSSSKGSLRVMDDLLKGVRQGQFLYSRLERYKKSFGDFAVNIIRVGEISGTLHENLNYLADEIKKRRELRRKVFGALVYPIFIIAATIGVTVLLTVYIFPKILPVLQGFKGQLPFTTRALIFTSGLLASKGWLIVLIILILAGGFTWLIRSKEKFHTWVDRQVLRLPALGRLFSAYHMSNFCRTLGILLKSDVPVVEAVIITSRTSTNLVYRDTFLELAQKAARGERLSAHLELHPKLFPAIVAQMMTVGESTGKLSDSLLYLAEIYENEVDDLTKNLSTSIEPILMVFMGLLVGFIAMSIITPIYGLTQSLSQAIP
jgi:type IV pilus assembly protein PilC